MFSLLFPLTPSAPLRPPPPSLSDSSPILLLAGSGSKLGVYPLLHNKLPPGNDKHLSPQFLWVSDSEEA